MALTDRLRRLDDAWVPTAARRWRRFRLERSRPGTTTSAVGQVRSAVQAEPALAGSVAVVLAAGILFAALGTGPDSDATSSPKPFVIPSIPATPLATIGPAPGTAVSVYLGRATQDLQHYAQIAAQRPTYAAVDFRSYLTPDQALAIIGKTQLVSAYVRVPSALPTLSRKVPVASAADLATGIASAGTVARATARTYAGLLKALHVQSTQDRHVAGQYRLQRRAAVLEASQLLHPGTCRCVFAFVVHANVQELNTIARSHAVRVVDPAPPAVPLTGLTVLPLQPQVRSVVPRDGLPGA
jgi:hypothetical protein